MRPELGCRSTGGTRVKQLGEILLDDGLVTEAQLLAALDETMARGSSLGRTLVELGVLTEGQLVKALANQVGMNFVDLDEFPVDRAAVTLVPGGAVPAVHRAPGRARGRLDRARDLRPGQRHGGRRRAQRRRAGPSIPVIATHDNLLRAIDRFCRADDEMEDLSSAFEEQNSEPEQDLSKIGDVVDDDAPDRAVREPAGHAGDHRPRVGHPHRAGRARPARAVPHRRRAARDAARRPSRSRTASSAASRS